MSVKAGLTAEDVLGKKNLKRESERDVRSAVSGLHSQRTEGEMLPHQLPCGHPDKMAS